MYIKKVKYNLENQKTCLNIKKSQKSKKKLFFFNSNNYNIKKCTVFYDFMFENNYQRHKKVTCVNLDSLIKWAVIFSLQPKQFHLLSPDLVEARITQVMDSLQKYI